QAYITKRCQSVCSATVKKEIATFGQLWKHCKRQEIVSGEPPWHSLRYPVHSGKPPFRTWAELEVMENPEWESLYLDVAQIKELLDYVGADAKYPFITPMLAFAAWTGARRSEIGRSLVSDWNLSTNVVMVRERKRRKGKATVRTVPIHPELRKVMEAWLPKCKAQVVHL